MVNKVKVNEKIVSLRKKKGLSQQDLAEALNVSRQAVSRWETGVTIPSSENLKCIGKLFDVSIDFLCSDSVEVEYEIKKDDTALVEHGYNHKLSGKEKHRKRIASVLAVVAVGVFLIILAIIYIDPWHVNKKDAIHINDMTREEMERAREGGFNLYLE